MRVLLQHDERSNAGQVGRSFSRRAAGGEFRTTFLFFFLARLWSQIAPFLSYSITNGVFVVGLRNENGKWELLVVFAAKTMKEWECNW